MILGMDHIAVTSIDLEADGAKLEQLGFRHKFTEIGLKNAEEKKPLLRNWSKTHDIAYYEGIEGTALELTQHHARSHEGKSRGFIPVIDESRVMGVIRAVEDLDKSKMFYSALGMTPEPWHGHMKFRIDSPVEKLRSSLLMGPTANWEESAPIFLDDAGFPCIALLTTDLDADARRLHNEATQFITDDFRLTVNKQKLRIAFACGPSGELIELVQVRQ